MAPRGPSWPGEPSTGWGRSSGSRRRRRIGRGLAPIPDGPGRRILQRVVTFHLICLGWVLFRADSLGTARLLLARLFTSFGAAPLVTPLVALAIALVIAMQYLPEDLPAMVQDRFSQLRPVT